MNMNDYYDDKERNSEFNLLMCGWSIIAIMAIIVFCMLFCSCGSVKYVPVPEYHTDSVYLTKVQFDSIWQHDSVYIREYVKGDTVYFEHTKWHTKYVEKEVHDTIYKSRTDSIAVPYPVEKPLTWWQRQKVEFGEVAMAILVGLLVFMFVRFKFLK